MEYLCPVLVARPASIGHNHVMRDRVVIHFAPPITLYIIILCDVYILFIIRKHDLDLYSLHISKSRGAGSLRDAAKCQGTAPWRLERESSTGNEQITDLRTLTGSKFLWSRFFISYKQYSEDTWKIKKSRVESCINSSLFSLKPLCDAKVRMYMIIFLPVARRVNMTFNLKDFKIIKPDVSESY